MKVICLSSLSKDLNFLSCLKVDNDRKYEYIVFPKIHSARGKSRIESYTVLMMTIFQWFNCCMYSISSALFLTVDLSTITFIHMYRYLPLLWLQLRHACKWKQIWFHIIVSFYVLWLMWDQFHVVFLSHTLLSLSAIAFWSYWYLLTVTNIW